MAEQFNKQQLLIAKSIAKNIEDEMQHIEDESLSFARLLSERGLDERDMEGFVNETFYASREDPYINLKILDFQGRLEYSSLAEPATAGELALLKVAKKTKPGEVVFVDKLADDRKVVLLTPIEGPKGKGVLLVEIMIKAVNQKFLAPIRAGIRGHAWMMDSSGTLLYHPTQPTMVGKTLTRRTVHVLIVTNHSRSKRRYSKAVISGSAPISPHTGKISSSHFRRPGLQGCHGLYVSRYLIPKLPSV